MRLTSDTRLNLHFSIGRFKTAFNRVTQLLPSTPKSLGSNKFRNGQDKVDEKVLDQSVKISGNSSFLSNIIVWSLKCGYFSHSSLCFADSYQIMMPFFNICKKHPFTRKRYLFISFKGKNMSYLSLSQQLKVEIWYLFSICLCLSNN